LQLKRGQPFARSSLSDDQVRSASTVEACKTLPVLALDVGHASSGLPRSLHLQAVQGKISHFVMHMPN